MPERDVFQRNVPWGFQSASRRILSADDDVNAPRDLVRALGRRLRDTGCPGFGEIIETVLEAVLSPDSEAARMATYDALERCQQKHLNCETTRVTHEAQKLVASRERVLLADSGLREVNRLRQRIGVELVAGLGDSLICPAGMLAKVHGEEKVPFDVLSLRRDRAKAAASNMPELAVIVERVLANPEGKLSAAPRVLRIRRSQEDILFNESLSS